MYEMLTGQTPFDEESAMSLALSHITNPPPSPQEIRSEISDEVAAVVLRALEKQPEDRFSTAVAMVEALKVALGNESNLGEESPFLEEWGEPSISDTPMEREKVSSSTVDLPKPRVAPKPQKAAPKAKPKTKAPRKAKAKSTAGSKGLPLRRIAIAIIVLGLIGGLAFLLTRGGDDNDSAKIQLIYNDQSLAVYNASDETLDLTGIKFALPDLSNHLDSDRFGADTQKEFVPGRCIVIQFDSDRVDIPEVCEANDRELTTFYYHQSKRANAYFWVWSHNANTGERFVVTLDDKVIRTCTLEAGSCTFSIPRDEE
jgi:serine/threonine protein kinase